MRHLRLATRVPSTTQGWAELTSLQWLDLQCASHPLPADLQRSLSSLTGLRHLRLACTDPELLGISTLRQLTCLQLAGCEQLQHLPGLSCLPQLQTLDVYFNSSLSSLSDSISSLSGLCSLDIRFCKHVTSLPIGALPELTSLKMSG